MHDHLTVSDVARRFGRRPRDISDLFYNRLIPDGECPIVGGRRLIPADLLPRIEAILSEQDARRGGSEPCGA